MYFSIIIPVYNRPDEIKELLDSMLLSTYNEDYEIVVIEDGSSITCKDVVDQYANKLNISYYFKSNSGPGDSRNYGMRKAKGDYFIIFDSDCIIPKQYLSEVAKELKRSFVDCFGGPDQALKSFSNIQKAINFTMTSFLTTGGIRGGSEKIDKFQPRSFNMGISKKAFETSKGFGNIHPGEDPDLSIRLWKMGFDTRLFSNCFVYHKRRIDWEKFTIQVSKFGKARPILNHWYPEYKKITYWFPSLFMLGLIASFICLLVLFDWTYNDWPLKCYFAYFILIFLVSSIQNLNPLIGLLSVVAVWKQFKGYGFGFLESFIKINILRKKPEVAFPELFFKKPTDEPENSKSKIFETQSKPIAVKTPVNVNTIELNPATIQFEAKQTHNPLNQPKEISEISVAKPNSLKNENKVQKPLIIGLTGGIGSGKTTLANYLKSLGVPVYISDLEAKKVMEFPEIITRIKEAFNQDVIKEGKLDREKLASIVFNKPEQLKLLNSIVHPAVKKHFESWIQQNYHHPILFKEAAILFESGSYKDCDAVVSVVAPLETRIERVLQRDKTSREKVLQRIHNQISDEERIARSQYVINNLDFEDSKRSMNEILLSLSNR